MANTYVDVPELILQNKHEKVIRESPNLVSILPYKPIRWQMSVKSHLKRVYGLVSF